MAVKAFSVLLLLSVLLILSPVFARDLPEKQDAKTDEPAQDQVDPNGLGVEKQYGFGPRPGYGYGYGRPGYGYGYGRPGYGYGYGRPGYGYGYGRPGYGYGYGCRFRCGYHCCSAKEFAEFMEAENLPEN